MVCNSGKELVTSDTGTCCRRLFAHLAGDTAELCFIGIQPPAVEAEDAEVAHDLRPIELASLGVPGVVPAPETRRVDIVECVFEDSVALIELGQVCGAEVETGPHGNDGVNVQIVNGPDHGRRIGIARGIETVTAPLVAGPVLPVLDDGIDAGCPSGGSGWRST